MKKQEPPTTDSLQELAKFWDTHDLTDFEDDLVEVGRPVFVRRTAVKVPLESREAKAVEKMALARGVSQGELIRSWVVQKLARGKNNRPTKRVG